MDALPIPEAITRAIDGDRLGQHFLFHYYKENVHRLVLRILGPANQDELDETIQKAFVEIFRSLRLFKGLSSFNTWVYRITVKCCTMTIRQRYRRKFAPFLWKNRSDPECVADTTRIPDRDLENRETGRAIYAALDAIPMEQRVAFILFEVEGKTLDEIAALELVPVATVKTRLFRARNRLVKLLKPFIDEQDA